MAALPRLPPDGPAWRSRIAPDILAQTGAAMASLRTAWNSVRKWCASTEETNLTRVSLAVGAALLATVLVIANDRRIDENHERYDGTYLTRLEIFRAASRISWDLIEIPGPQRPNPNPAWTKDEIGGFQQKFNEALAGFQRECQRATDLAFVPGDRERIEKARDAVLQRARQRNENRFKGEEGKDQGDALWIRFAYDRANFESELQAILFREEFRRNHVVPPTPFPTPEHINASEYDRYRREVAKP